MFVLNKTDRLAILAGCGGLLLFATLITICAVCPFCWIHRRLHRTKAHTPLKKKSSSRKFYGGDQNLSCFLEREPPPPYNAHDEAEMVNCAGFFNFDRKLTPTNSNSSATDSVAGIPLPFEDKVDIPEPTPPSPEGDHGHVSVGLFYANLEEREEVMGHLTIVIKEGIDLPFRLYGGYCDPYIVVELFKVRGRRKIIKPGEVPLCEFKTSIARKTQNPVYNEAFVIPFYSKDLRKCSLKLTAWDSDRLANDSPFGECILHLRDLPLQDEQELFHTIALKETKQSNGQLLLGLCYLPTAEKMTVAVLKAINLKTVDDKGHGAVYVQAMAIYGGKVLERRKTSCRHGTAFPVFNEMLMFDVPYAKLEHVVLLVVVRNSTDSAHSKSSPRKGSYVGKVAIGSCCKRNGSNHWNAMKNSPRRQIIQWHVLR